jgi:RNA polymerase sigma factor (TIGR02999 family)
MTRLHEILECAVSEDRPLSEVLLPLVYDELRSLATSKLPKGRPEQTIQATALVHEAWMRMGGDETRHWNDRAHFFRTAALAMRNILVERARSKATTKRGASAEMLRIDEVRIDELPVANTSQDQRVLLVDAALEHLETELPDHAQVVILKFFGGLTNKDIAAVQGVTERTVDRHWAFAKARLYDLICHELGE